MELLYVNEHLTCFNYDGGERPAVESVRFDSAKPCVVEVVEPEIVILLNGGINISFEKVRNGRIAAGEMVVLPPCDVKHRLVVYPFHVFLSCIKVRPTRGLPFSCCMVQPSLRTVRQGLARKNTAAERG